MVLKLKSLFDLSNSPTNEQHYIQHLERHLWKGKPISPFDPASETYKCANGRYKCKNTSKYFTVKTGTIFENTKLPLRKWFQALYVLTSHKKGISSYQLAKDIDITQKSAWFVLHRLRHASNLSLFKEMLKDFVEIDETFIGGKNRNRHWDKKAPKCQGRNWKDKIPVWGAMERNGNLICQVVPNTQRKTIEPIVKANVKEGATVYTDEWFAYDKLYKYFNHQRVNHSAKQYVKEKASTNSIENAWSHLKGSIRGTYHWISRKHTQKYLDEFTMRYNTRKYNEEDRFNLVLSSVAGKRLTYRELISHY